MGKKKRQNQNSNVSVVDSSESESSKDSSQTTEAANKSVCPHFSRSVELSNVRKNIKVSKDKNIHSVCSLCKKNESTQCKDGWVCLRCGSINCGPEERDHRVDHYKTPRSDSHILSYQLNTNIIWCFQCEREIPLDISKKVQGCAEFIKKQFNDHTSFSPVRAGADTKKMNGTEPAIQQEASLYQPVQSISLAREQPKPVLGLPKVRGLINLGNTCFFNSVLQCLAQTPGLVDLLREMDVPGEKFHLELDGIEIDAVLEKHRPSLLSDQLAQILTEVSGVNPSGDGKMGHYTVNPRQLLNALTSKCPQFEGGDQHDAHELLRHLLDSVHMEDLRRYQKAILSHIGYNKNLDELDEDKKQFGKKLNQKVCDTIPIRPDQIFKGTLVSILQCTVCGHISKREEPFLDLSLPVAQEKAQPPIVRRKQNCSSPVEEEQNSKITPSKHQLKKEKRMARRISKGNKNKKEKSQGEPTIQEEDKKDSIDGEQSDADVEDNEDNACEEQDHKAEIVESGYSSEKQMSARGSPITTQSPEEECKPISQGCETDPECSNGTNSVSVYPAITSSLVDDPNIPVAKRTVSSLESSIQELTLTIPEEINMECTSQDSVCVNASNGSPDISSDSQQGFVNVDLFENKLPPCDNSQIDRTAMVNDWNCSGDANSSSVSLSVSPQHTQSNTSPNSNDNMSVCNSLPENISMILNSPIKSHSGSDERPESRMECPKNRSSPVELGEATQLDSGLLKLSLEGMTCVTDVEVNESSCKLGKAIPLPPPLPSFTSSYSFTHQELAIPRYNNAFPKHKIEEGECSLQSCLNQFTLIEVLAGANKVGCEACTEKANSGNKEGKTVYQNSTKQLQISNPPPVMIFHLKRFQVQRCSFRKISRHVEFPLVLDISPFCYLNEVKPKLYSLYGVVEHSGTLHGGHYVAYVKVRTHNEQLPGQPPPGKWYYISDSRVSDIDESFVLNTQAYLLFYERIL